MIKKKFKLFNGNRLERYDYLITKEQPLSYTTEAFQKIIINMEYSNIDKKYKVIQFTSTLAAEGKTTFLTNLAYLIAKHGKKVILVDLDLRKPKLHRVFNAPNKDGLTDYLSGKIEYNQLVVHSETFGFDHIIAGEKTTAITNVLEAKKMSELIKKLKENYDYVLLDTPPVIAVSDALYVAKNADGVIFIVAQGVVKKNLVKEAIQILQNNNVPIIGTVLTQVSRTRANNRYDYGFKHEE